MDKNEVYHIELNDVSDTNVVFLQDPYHNHYFGTFEGKYLDESKQRDIDELNKKILGIKKKENLVEGRNLSHKLLGVLCEKGFEEAVINYYKKYWSTSTP